MDRVGQDLGAIGREERRGRQGLGAHQEEGDLLGLAGHVDGEPAIGRVSYDRQQRGFGFDFKHPLSIRFHRMEFIGFSVD